MKATPRSAESRKALDVVKAKPYEEAQKEWERWVASDPARKNAIEEWSTYEFDSIRMQEANKILGGTASKFNQVLDEAPKYNGSVYRGTTEQLKDLTEGSEYLLSSSTSSSKSLSVASGFARSEDENRGYTILQVKTRSGVDISSMVDAEHTEEEEVVLRKNTKYRVVGRADGVRMPYVRKDEAGEYVRGMHEVTVIKLEEI